MGPRAENWREILGSARGENNLEKQLNLCLEARELMQKRLIDLSVVGDLYGEREAIEAGLREIWQVEESARKKQQ